MGNLKTKGIVLFIVGVVLFSCPADARRVKEDSLQLELKAATEIIEIIIEELELSAKDLALYPATEPDSKQRLLAEFILGEVTPHTDYIAEFMFDYLKKFAALYDRDMSEFRELISEHNGLRGFLKRDFKISLNAVAGATGFQMFDGALYEFIGGLIKEKAQRGDFSITVKSVCCSTGLEPYQVAMILHKKLTEYAQSIGEEPEVWINKWNINIYAYDISMEALYKAKEGVYPSRETSLYPEYMDYFDTVDDGNLQVISILRGWVKPTYIDLTSDPTSGIVSWHPAELVLFINPRAADLLIYLCGIRDYLREVVFNRGYEGLFIYGESRAGITYETLDSKE